MYRQVLISLFVSFFAFFSKVQGQTLVVADSTFLRANITAQIAFVPTDLSTLKNITLSDLEKYHFKTFGKEAIPLGMSNQRILIKFDLLNLKNDLLYLSLSEPINNFAELIMVENGNIVKINSAGYIDGKKRFSTRKLTYRLDKKSDMSHTYYLLVEYSIINNLKIHLNRYDALIGINTRGSIIIGLLVGFVVSIMLLNFFIALMTREQELWYNFGFNLGLLLAALSMAGLGIEFIGWSPNTIHYISIFGNIGALISLLFISSFLELNFKKNKLIVFFHFVIAANYIISALLVFTPWGIRYSMPLLELGAMTAVAYYILLGVRQYLKIPNTSNRLFIIGFVSVFLFASAFVLQFWGWLTPNLNTDIAFTICVNFFTFFLTVACVAKIIEARQEKERLLVSEKANLEKNVSERTKALHVALENVLESKKKYRLLAENTQDIVAIHDLDCNLTYVAPSIRNYGYDHEEVLSQSLSKLVYKDDLLRLLALAKQAIAHGKAQLFEYRMFDKKSQTYVWMEGMGTVILGADETPSGFLVTSRNIQNRKESDTKIEQYTKELERSNADLENFAHVASHDIKSPLRTVYSYLQLIERRSKDKFDATDKEYIGFIKDSVYQMNMLIDSVLSYAKIGKNIGAAKPIIFADIEQMVVRNLNTIIKEKNATITWENCPEIINGHLPTLIQIFQNLVNNALKYNKSEQATVYLSSFLNEKGDTVYMIKDNGIGIEARFQKTIFSMFTRLHQHNEYEGTGVGLALCSRLIDYYGGEIWVESAFGEGSTFFFTLPATQL